jgi:hypothetical protein
MAYIRQFLALVFRFQYLISFNLFPLRSESVRRVISGKRVGRWGPISGPLSTEYPRPVFRLKKAIPPEELGSRL